MSLNYFIPLSVSTSIFHRKWIFAPSSYAREVRTVRMLSETTTRCCVCKEKTVVFFTQVATRARHSLWQNCVLYTLTLEQLRSLVYCRYVIESTQSRISAAFFHSQNSNPYFSTIKYCARKCKLEVNYLERLLSSR